jgi:hypothetical protein
MTTMPPMWQVLMDDSGPTAIVVPVNTKPIDALLELLNTHCGNQYTAANPVLIAEAATMKGEFWRSYTKQWKEDNGAPDWDDGDWWAPDGDGKRRIYVFPIERSTDVLDEMAAEAEPMEAM